MFHGSLFIDTARHCCPQICVLYQILAVFQEKNEKKGFTAEGINPKYESRNPRQIQIFKILNSEGKRGAEERLKKKNLKTVCC